MRGTSRGTSAKRSLGELRPLRLSRVASVVLNSCAIPCTVFPRFHGVSIMHNPLSSNLITAARQRNLQFLPRHNHARILHIIKHLDLLVRHQSRKHHLRNVRQGITGHYRVHGRVYRIPSAVIAGAGECDSDGLLGGHGLVG